MMKVATLVPLVIAAMLAGAPAALAGPATLDPTEMSRLPDDKARAAARAFADAVVREDAAAMKALVPEKGMHVLKKKKSRTEVVAILDKSGVAGLVGYLPRGLVLPRSEHRDHVEQIWHVEFEAKKKLVVIYSVEDGVGREALLGVSGGDWKLVELRDAYHGKR
jgi:hypothetical protein